jgi:geranylgeranyl diphosphate synthase type II
MDALAQYNGLCESSQPAIISFLRSFAAAQITDERLRAGSLHLLGLGKLVRPMAVIAAARTFAPDIPLDACLHTAAAMELIHTFTLVHDDLPEMDNAALRRGVPAVHLKYGGDIGLLAGDGLFALAITAVSEDPMLEPGQKVSIFREAASAVIQIIEGQAGELALSGKDATAEQVESVELRKTAVLFACSLVCGAIIARAGDAEIEQLRQFGMLLGRAFQIMDDLLSATGDRAKVGKSLEQDEVLQRPTIVRLLGVGGARKEYEAVNAAALQALAKLGAADTPLLLGLHQSLLSREK